MNTDNRKYKVNLTRRLAKELDPNESETTFDLTELQNGDTTIECRALVCCKSCSEDDTDNRRKENEDNTDNFRNVNEDDIDDQRKGNGKDHAEEAYYKLVGGRTYNSEQRAVNQLYPFSVIDFLSILFSVILFCLDFMTDIMPKITMTMV